nr:uncharacterized protein LOC109989961 [Labrus bergylta]
MTRAALTRILILVILAFIICLPEFFTLYRASKVNFLCLPYRPCEPGNEVKRGEDGKIRKNDIVRDGKCDPSQIPAQEKWEQACEHESQRNTTDSRRDDENLEKSWFMCETDLDMSELQRNISSSGLKVHLEVSVEFQLRQEETLNLTLYGHNNLSSLHLHPIEGAEEEEEEKDHDEGQLKAFYCCLPVVPKSRSANQSRCLLWLSNQTVLNATAKEELPGKRTEKDEWRCMFRVLWLALLGVFLLAVLFTVLGEFYWRRCFCRKPKRQPVGFHLTSQQLNDGETQTEDMTYKGMILQPYGSHSWSGLSPIQEVDIQDDIETLLDGNVDNIYTENLHHRGHPSTSSLTEEHTW